MYIYLVGDELITETSNLVSGYDDEDPDCQKVRYTRQQIIAEIFKKDQCRAFYNKVEAQQCAAKLASHYLSCTCLTCFNYKNISSKSPILKVEIPDWVNVFLSSDDKGTPLSQYKIYSRFIQKIISIELDGETILSNENNYRNTLKWPVGNILFSSLVVGGFLWAGVIAGGLVSFFVGVGSLILVGLFERGIQYYQRFRKPANSILESEPFEDESNSSHSIENAMSFDHRLEWKGQPIREVKEPSINIHRLLARYDQQKGCRRRYFGDQKDIAQLKSMMGVSVRETKSFSSKEMFDLCKIVLEQTTEVEHESHKVLHEIKREMAIKKDNKLAPFAVAQFLKCVGLLQQNNFERLCACSLRDQEIICNIMQNLSLEKCTQSLFDILCDNTSKIRLGKVDEYHIRRMAEHFDEEDNFLIFRIQKIIEYCVRNFYSILTNLSIELHTQNNISRLCELTASQLFYFTEKIRSDHRYTQEDFERIFDSVTPVNEKMMALCMGIHPDLGAKSPARLFAGAAAISTHGVMAGLGEKKLLAEIRKFL